MPGYIAPLVIITAGYALFQTANNTAVMADIRPDERGVISGMLNLSRNLGLITGASVMGAVFALAAGTTDTTPARPEAIAAGMRVTFAVAAMLIIGALALAVGAYRRALRNSQMLQKSSGGRPQCPPASRDARSVCDLDASVHRRRDQQAAPIAAMLLRRASRSSSRLDVGSPTRSSTSRQRYTQS